MARATKSDFFRPGSPARDKAATTTSASRAIIDAEAAAREAKTQRLRMLRLAAAPADPEPAKKGSG